MSLRARLVLAFLLLAVVPLTGVTLYSYVTTQRAFRKAVEAEAAALAEDMSSRMDGVTQDLGRRLARLSEIRLASETGARPPSSDERAERLLARVQGEMGDAAALVESLEIVPGAPAAPLFPEPGAQAALPVPAPPAPAPPALVDHPAPAADAGPRPVIVLAPEAVAKSGGSREFEYRWVFKQQEIARAAREAAREIDRHREEIARASAEAARTVEAVRAAGGTAQPQDAREAEVGPGSAHPPEAAEEQARVVGEAVARAVAGFTRALADAQRAKEQQGREAARETLRQATREAAREAEVAWRSIKRHMARGVEIPIEREGAAVGTLRARIRSQELLAGVFERTRRSQGEIPFAVDEEGRLYAPTDGKPKIEALGVAAASVSEPFVEKTSGDWVVVKRRDPESGLTFGIARPVGDAIQELQRTAARNLAYGLGMIGLALVGILPLSRRMTRDLETLTAGAERLAQGDLDTRVPVRSRDEFGRLSEAFNRMARDLRSHQEQLLAQERLRKELEMGRRIQEEMLPHDRLRVPFAEVKGVSIPAREVGGDFFNYFLLPDGEAALLVGDVSGKGVAAALLMANIQGKLRARLPVERDLVSLARHLDVEVDQTTPMTVYVTCFMAVLDGRQRALRYVNAGHNAPFVLRADGSIEALESTGRPLGLYPGGDYEERSIALAAGDSLFLYTDGLVETEDANGEPFGAERIKQVLVAEAAAGLDGILTRLEQVVRDYRGGREAEDDATMVVLRVGGPSPA
jgi:serine phosphatase RsbU (regulator of sigma subunit)